LHFDPNSELLFHFRYRMNDNQSLLVNGSFVQYVPVRSLFLYSYELHTYVRKEVPVLYTYGRCERENEVVRQSVGLPLPWLYVASKCKMKISQITSYRRHDDDSFLPTITDLSFMSIFIYFNKGTRKPASETKLGNQSTASQ
jgi:hypothetical protein